MATLPPLDPVSTPHCYGEGSRRSGKFGERGEAEKVLKVKKLMLCCHIQAEADCAIPLRCDPKYSRGQTRASCSQGRRCRKHHLPRSSGQTGNVLAACAQRVQLGRTASAVPSHPQAPTPKTTTSWLPKEPFDTNNSMMATVLPATIMAPSFNRHASQCIDPEQDFFDFNELASPAPAHLKRESSAVSTATSPANTLLDEDLQTPAKPSYEYERFKQQTGYPSGSIPGLSSGYNSGFTMFSSTGLDEISMMNDSSIMDGGWNSGLSVDTAMHMGMDIQQPAYFYANDASQDDFVDPSVITHDDVPRVRVYPGHHQQQAAKAQAQALAQQQRQQQQQQQQMAHHRQQSQQQNRLQPQQVNRKTSSPLSDARTEETIARVVAQIRQNSQNAALASQDGQQNLLPHIIRAKKDEDDMDEDERLLASEEGKKLSSKERRQLRNKVSARAFRSRRKEYIGQLEGEIAQKVQEANELRTQNLALMEENTRSRAFIERLLRHQAFTPFLDELSREEGLQPKAPLASMPSTSTPVVAAPTPAPFQPQQFGGMPRSENTHVGMTLVPETQIDFSMLNINQNSNNANWGMNNGFNFQQPRVYAVLELPEGPANPLDVEAMSGKGYSALFAAEDNASVEETKPDYPVIERPAQSQMPAVAASSVEEDDEDDEYALYRSSPAPSSAASLDKVFGTIVPEKVFAHFDLVVSDEAEEVRSMELLERRISAMEPCFQRIAAMTSMLDL
ncbi:hypothetical protein P153DRAFT_379422 [Dothidotthia symphoricarpi CBS 119687]|uniref:BZIP domain-containing protein n=1 Tax=Dothidotthia symphoricarpi CBS 119687 TaxID=1392245 RepID=A0A6A6A114_9PLEO|nr:uncharacterized protein P153DRAFT_379422 [Dothidotthia symphoricarpi CBS 119687]KAF2124844.1 hypothetical protein P153DRAFT_379422 [Dothidotthia symphoricarpi CBS 119687]